MGFKCRKVDRSKKLLLSYCKRRWAETVASLPEWRKFILLPDRAFNMHLIWLKLLGFFIYSAFIQHIKTYW